MADTIASWLLAARHGDAEAVHNLWQHYYPDVLRYAKKCLRGTPQRSFDDEDISQSVFGSFFRRLQDDQFQQLSCSDDLLKLLMTITARKVVNQVHYEAAEKRGGGQIWDQAALASDPKKSVSVIDRLASDEPTADVAFQMVEHCQRLLDLLDDGTLYSIALWRLEGYTVDEIAAKLDCSQRRIFRKLKLIRTLWREEV